MSLNIAETFELLFDGKTTAGCDACDPSFLLGSSLLSHLWLIRKWERLLQICGLSSNFH